MRPGIPKPTAVDSSFRLLTKRLGSAQKRINREAAREMKSGDYETAQKWMAVGRALADFADRAGAYSAEWRTLVRTSRIAGASETKGTATAGASGRRKEAAQRTPAWRFYQPALRAVLQDGGEATLEQVIARLETDLAGQLSAKDLASSPKGRGPKWHDTIRSVRRLCQREGWLDKAAKDIWRLTEKGRQTASETDGAGWSRRIARPTPERGHPFGARYANGRSPLPAPGSSGSSLWMKTARLKGGAKLPTVLSMRSAARCWL